MFFYCRPKDKLFDTIGFLDLVNTDVLITINYREIKTTKYKKHYELYSTVHPPSFGWAGDRRPSFVKKFESKNLLEVVSYSYLHHALNAFNMCI